MIRIATENDAEKLLEIYRYYVENTAVSFEYETPSVDEFKERIRKTQEKYPYLVSERGGKLVGYAYAGPFHSRSAYGWSAETTIYIARDERQTGLGRELYTALENALSLQNILNLNACIGYPSVEDAYLTKNSFRFHERLGYRLAGEFHQCGYKFGRWYGVVWMEKIIGEHPAKPLPVAAFAEIKAEFQNRYHIG